MSKTVIKVENLSKAYQIGQFGTGTISRDIERWWVTRIRGKEDPFLKIGETNDRSVKGLSNIVWSLKDLNFDIQQGDAVGIIGKNGAGKSTLLKLLSRVTAPSSGSIKVKGRIASLLEVGTGFHPELTGRENIYLNGAILGMRKKEISQRLEEIINFSGVERYIDTPVKRYSSGMYVRLAFSVAAHLESEILIIDEVLAVGDAEFQKKCLGKMGEVSKGEGRTILFVSHNMGSIIQLCNKSILLKNGTIDCYDDTEIVTGIYQSVNRTIQKKIQSELIEINEVNLYNEEKRQTEQIKIGESCEFEISFIAKTDSIKIDIGIHIYNSNETPVMQLTASDISGYIQLSNEKNKIKKARFHLKSNTLVMDNYRVNVLIVDEFEKILCVFNNALNFEMINTGLLIKRNINKKTAVFIPECNFHLQ